MFASIFKSIGVALMSVIMAIFSAIAPPQDKPDTGSGNSGQIQQEVKISLDAAIDIAVADAGVARADAKFTEAKLDSDDLVAHYDIEFIAGANEYDNEIAVADGSILKKEVEPADPSKPSKPQPDVSGYISITRSPIPTPHPLSPWRRLRHQPSRKFPLTHQRSLSPKLSLTLTTAPRTMI